MIADEYAALWPKAVRVAQRAGARDPEDTASAAVLSCLQAERRKVEQGKAVCASYVYETVKNRVLDEHEYWGRRPLMLSADGAGWLLCAEDSYEGVALADYRLYLDRLTDKQRLVVLLRAEGWQFKEIGQLPGFTEHGAKKLLLRAQAKSRAYRADLERAYVLGTA